MKRNLIIISMILAVVLSGCSLPFSKPKATSEPTYITKYVINTDKLDMREEPSSSSSIICSIEKDKPLSFVEESQNGYSKVIYEGTAGYVLAAYLTQQKPSDTDSDNNTVNNTQPQNNEENTQTAVSQTDSIISSRSVEEIENYITSYVRPLYNDVNNNLNNYSQTSSDGVTYWHDGKGYIKKEFKPSVNGYGMSREYYYDTDSGRIAFAFVYSGSTEYRLYFRTNQLVRYISPDGTIINNPTAQEALDMGRYVISEAY